MSTQMPQNNNCTCCCCCPMNCPKNQKPEMRKKEENNGLLWAVLIGGGLAVAMSGCVPETNTSHLETLNASPQTQILVHENGRF